MNRSKAVPSGLFQPQTLEVDEKIFDKNLRIVEDLDNDQAFMYRPLDKKATSLLPEPELPSVTIAPDSGMCVKTKNIEGEKFFINVCKIQAIPPARPIDEERLQNIIASEDYTSDYKIPMSLGSPRTEKDKSGKDCLVCDVAVNSVWYDETMVDSLTFTTFLIQLAMEGLCDKYGDVCNLDRQSWSILRNKRYMGKLQRHTIQQRASATKIQEIIEVAKVVNSASPVIVTKSQSKAMDTPSVVLLKEPHDSAIPKTLVAKINLPKELSKDGIVLELGEDRLVLQSDHYSLDIFLPFMVEHQKCTAEFIVATRQLIVKTNVKSE